MILKAWLYNDSGEAITGSAVKGLVIQDSDANGDLQVLDHDDGTFKDPGSPTTPEVDLVEVDAVNLPGFYRKEVTSTGWLNGFYSFRVRHTASPKRVFTGERYLVNGQEYGLSRNIPGTGTVKQTHTVKLSDGTPVPMCTVEVSTDTERQNIIATGVTDSFGIVYFWLDPGSYKFWHEKMGYTFSNPYDVEVS